jgi:predicted ATPase/DNA-binding SARP family transcriptional activator
VQFGVLGPLHVVNDDGRPLPLTGAKERALLGALLIDPGAVVSVDRLVDVLWGNAVPSNPVNALQARVSALRRVLGREVVENRPPGYRLAVSPDTVDAVRFARLVAAGERAGTAHAAIEAYDQALGLWRGTPFADFEYEDFARSEITRLSELRDLAVEHRVDAMLALGRHDETVAELERLVIERPLRERHWGQLMLALYRVGRQADALRAFQEAAQVLGDELGIEPSKELRELEEAILLQDDSLAAPPAAAASPRHNLPPRRTSLVGRDQEIATVSALLNEHRLVTMVGPGGVGKTTLAIACAEGRLSYFPDGAWLVELAAVTDPQRVPVAVATGLGLATGDRSTLELVCDHLAERQLLLVLDNCEHLIDGVAQVADTVLRHAPHIRIIATCREPLGVPGEILWPTRPLGLSDVDEGGDLGPAMRLFLDRARSAFPDFELDAAGRRAVAEICRRLDGLPLAIELAAARVRTMSVHDIASRLDDRFHLLTGGARTLLPRQQTLEATIAWSFHHLSEEERELCRRLSVFAGGWTLEWADAIASELGDVLDLHTRLVDRSLVSVNVTASGGSRYGMLETIRHYAARELAASDTAGEIALRHARHFLELAEQAEFQGPHQAAWTERLAVDHDNLVAAVGNALGHDRRDIAARLGGALAWWWFFGNREEGRGILDEILAVDPDASDSLQLEVLDARALLDFFGPSTRTLEVARSALHVAAGMPPSRSTGLARVLAALGGVARDDAEHSLSLLEAAREIFEEIGDGWGSGLARFQTMEVLAHRGQLREAIEVGRSALELFRPTEDPWAISAALAHLTRLSRLTGQTGPATDLAHEAHRVAEERGLPHTVQFVMTDQAYLAFMADDVDAAVDTLTAALTIAGDVGNPVGVATIRNALGEMRLAEGVLAGAGELHAQARAGFEQLELGAGVAYSIARQGLVAECGGESGRALSLYEEGLRIARRAGAVLEGIPCYEGLGRIAVAGGRSEDGARLLAYAAAQRRHTGYVPLSFEQARTDAAEDEVSGTLRGLIAAAVDPNVPPLDLFSA